MNSYLLEWLGLNDIGMMFRHRIFVVAKDEETARRDLVAQAVQWGCQCKKIECLGAAPVQTDT